LIHEEVVRLLRDAALCDLIELGYAEILENGVGVQIVVQQTQTVLSLSQCVEYNLMRAYQI